MISRFLPESSIVLRVSVIVLQINVSSLRSRSLLNLMQDPRHNLGILYMEYIMQAAAKEAEEAAAKAEAAAI